jgi:hypothetical protein
MENLIITPKTKIFDLLKAFPELEDELIQLAPQFEKLKNPFLRKTITKITNLGQAAAIGGLNVETLVNRLRAKAGQHSLEALDKQGSNYVTEQPAWFDETAIRQSIDIRILLNAGEQPVHEVLAALKKSEDHEIVKVIAPFIPAPLIDKSVSLGFAHWLDKRGEEEYLIYFGKTK